MKVRFIRDDGERLALTMASGFMDAANTDWLPAKALRTSTFTYSGADGGQMVAQNYDPWQIKFSGFLKRTTPSSVWEIRHKFLTFFAKQHTYKAVFTRCDGSDMAVMGGWISTAPEIVLVDKLEHIQNYSITLTFGDPYLYSYAEDSQGNQIYSKSVEISRAVSETMNGYRYSNGGYVYYGGGYVYYGARRTDTTVFIDSVIEIAPVWRVFGPAKNPTLLNNTTNKQISYKGTIRDGQVLVVDCQNQTATIDTANVAKNINGEWMVLASGDNTVDYQTDNIDAPACKVEWNEVLG